jgi:4-amino-4-deoxychorismate lyase
MTQRVFVGGTRVDALPPDNRGLSYGDGVFETMRVHRGAVHWRDAHWVRLEEGAKRLQLRLPGRACVDAHIDELLQAHPDDVLKLVVTRGAGGRGYAPRHDADPVWTLSTHPPPPPPRPGGVMVRWCDTRLAMQPLLAGIKHCNRLEQVMARGEWSQDGIDEGLMRDTGGQAVCATAANLFVRHDGRWTTPPVDQCGVAGICRGWALSALGARIATLDVAQVETADAVFLCNAVRGILPVARLGARGWLPHPALAEAIGKLADAHPAFADRLENP